MATRAALALGLHLQRENCGFDLEGLEARNRLWWSIYYIDHVLSTVTGRLSHLPSSSSQRPPLPFTRLDPSDFDKSRDLEWTLHQDRINIDPGRAFLMLLPVTSALYFFYQVDLGLIMQAISTHKYGSDTAQRNRPKSTSYIEFYSQKLDQWKARLHPSFIFEDNDGKPLPHNGGMSSYTDALACAYYSSRIILSRPFLDQPGSGENQDIGSQLPKNAPGDCLHAATALIGVLPDQPDIVWPDIVWPYNLPLWWNLLHFVTQATVVLLDHISTISVPEHAPDEGNTMEQRLGPATGQSPAAVLEVSRKAFLWLERLSETSLSAFQAFKMCDCCIRRMPATRDLDLSGFPTARQPSRWAVVDVSE